MHSAELAECGETPRVPGRVPSGPPKPLPEATRETPSLWRGKRWVHPSGAGQKLHENPRGIWLANVAYKCPDIGIYIPVWVNPAGQAEDSEGVFAAELEAVSFKVKRPHICRRMLHGGS